MITSKERQTKKQTEKSRHIYIFFFWARNGEFLFFYSLQICVLCGRTIICCHGRIIQQTHFHASRTKSYNIQISSIFPHIPIDKCVRFNENTNRHTQIGINLQLWIWGDMSNISIARKKNAALSMFEPPTQIGLPHANTECDYSTETTKNERKTVQF